MDAEDYTVGVVAGLTGVSVRTLHHYDQTGLLQPGQRNAAGYRMYSPEDLQRLQRILFYRELGFGLEAIAAILADSESTNRDHLQRQRQLLADRIARCQVMMAVIDKELLARKMGLSLTPQERLEIFGSTRLEDHASQAERRWGGTAQLAQRQHRTSGYTRQDWLQLRTEQASIHQRLLDAMKDGLPATDPAVMDLAEEHRQHAATRDPTGRHRPEPGPRRRAGCRAWHQRPRGREPGTGIYATRISSSPISRVVCMRPPSASTYALSTMVSNTVPFSIWLTRPWVTPIRAATSFWVSRMPRRTAASR
jgi:DNA-binding transcriptional MerR regulator